MALKLKTQVRQVLPAAIKGVIDDVQWDPVAEKFRYLVTFINDNGAQQRWFWQDEVEAAPAEGEAQ